MSNPTPTTKTPQVDERAREAIRALAKILRDGYGDDRAWVRNSVDEAMDKMNASPPPPSPSVAEPITRPRCCDCRRPLIGEGPTEAGRYYCGPCVAWVVPLREAMPAPDATLEPKGEKPNGHEHEQDAPQGQRVESPREEVQPARVVLPAEPAGAGTRGKEEGAEGTDVRVGVRVPARERDSIARLESIICEIACELDWVEQQKSGEDRCFFRAVCNRHGLPHETRHNPGYTIVKPPSSYAQKIAEQSVGTEPKPDDDRILGGNQQAEAWAALAKRFLGRAIEWNRALPEPVQQKTGLDTMLAYFDRLETLIPPPKPKPIPWPADLTTLVGKRITQRYRTTRDVEFVVVLDATPNKYETIKVRTDDAGETYYDPSVRDLLSVEDPIPAQPEGRGDWASGQDTLEELEGALLNRDADVVRYSIDSRNAEISTLTATIARLERERDEANQRHANKVSECDHLGNTMRMLRAELAVAKGGVSP